MNMRKMALALVGGLALGVGTMMTTGAAQAAPGGLSSQLNADAAGISTDQIVQRLLEEIRSSAPDRIT